MLNGWNSPHPLPPFNLGFFHGDIVDDRGFMGVTQTFSASSQRQLIFATENCKWKCNCGGEFGIFGTMRGSPHTPSLHSPSTVDNPVRINKSVVF